MGSKLFHVEEQTDMTKVTVICRMPDDARKSRPHKLRYSKTSPNLNISTWKAYVNFEMHGVV